MKNFNYNLIIQNNGNEIEIKTNDVNYAIRECLRADKAGCEVCLCNGFTGEVLCHNRNERYCTEEMALMMLGFVVEQAGAEEEKEDEPVEVVEIDPTAVPSDDVLDNLRQLARNGNFLAQALLS